MCQKIVRRIFCQKEREVAKIALRIIEEFFSGKFFLGNWSSTYKYNMTASAQIYFCCPKKESHPLQEALGLRLTERVAQFLKWPLTWSAGGSNGAARSGGRVGSAQRNGHNVLQPGYSPGIELV